MTLQFNKPNQSSSLLFNLILVVGGVLLINGLIFGLEWTTDSSEKIVTSSALNPAGWLVGAAWTLWFIGLAISRWLIRKDETANTNTIKVLIDVLIVSCLLYPLYSLAIGSVICGLIGNIFPELVTLYVFRSVYKFSRPAAWLIFPIIPWVTCATVITLVEIGVI